MTEKTHNEFTHESVLDAEGIVAYLRALADGFSNRTLRLSDRRGEMVLKPNGLVNFEVQAERHGDKIAFEVRFAWKDSDEPESHNGALQIEARDRS